MNTQIPSGLQALMQASQILQQEAAQTAPGPQGQQPTVASQVQQAASQQMPQQMPNVQQVGQQAGIAAQLMAQRQQQAQDPRAVAQMAAQMLQQQGVASLPTNMQFREGGIIGYAGPEGSVVTNPIPDREGPNFQETFYDRVRREVQELREGERPELSPDVQSYLNRQQRSDDTGLSMAERANQQLLRQGSIYASPAERAKTAARYAQNPYSSSAPMANPEVRDMYAGLGEQQKAIRAYERPGLAQLIETDRPIKSAVPAIVEGAARAVRSVGEAVLGPQPDETAYNRELRLKNLEALTDTEGSPLPVDRREEEALRGVQLAQGEKPASAPVAPPKPSQPSSGIVQALPSLTPVRADRPATPTYPTIPEDPEEKRLRKEYASSGAKLLDAKKDQADLEAEGIAALRSSEAERKRLLESKRSRDSFNSFMALVRDLRLRNNEYGAYMASIDARDEADRLAGLANEQAVIKLKEAQQAKALGNIALERELKKEAYSTYVEGRKRAEDAAKNQATFAAQIFSTESSAANSMADRANQVNIELARMAQQAQARKDTQEIKRAEDLRTRLAALTSQLARSGDQIASELKKNERFKSIESLRDMAAKNMPLNDAQKKLIQEFSDEKRRLEQRVLPTINAQLDAVMKELGIVVPQVPAVKFDSSGNRIQ